MLTALPQTKDPLAGFNGPYLKGEGRGGKGEGKGRRGKGRGKKGRRAGRLRTQ